MSRPLFDTHLPTFAPVIVRQDGHYGAGPVVWRVSVVRPFHPDPSVITFVVHTPSIRRHAAREIAEQVLDLRGVRGSKRIAVHLIGIER